LGKLCYNIWVFIHLNKKLKEHIDNVTRDVLLIQEGRGDETDCSDESYNNFLELMSSYELQRKKIFG
jgi:hypothetical protein